MTPKWYLAAASVVQGYIRSFLVPKDVGDALKKLKLELMTGYKAGLALKVELKDKNEGENKITFYAFNQMDK